jgi:hypothetical protein
MGELEDKLNSILSSPKDMEKILGLARELSGTLGGSSESDAPKSPNKTENSNMHGNDIDPNLLKLASRLMSEYSVAGNDKTALVASIKPYLKEERREALDNAVKAVKIAHIAKIALSEFSGGEQNSNI